MSGSLCVASHYPTTHSCWSGPILLNSHLSEFVFFSLNLLRFLYPKESLLQSYCFFNLFLSPTTYPPHPVILPILIFPSLALIYLTNLEVNSPPWFSYLYFLIIFLALQSHQVCHVLVLTHYSLRYTKIWPRLSAFASSELHLPSPYRLTLSLFGPDLSGVSFLNITMQTLSPAFQTSLWTPFSNSDNGFFKYTHILKNPNY